MRAASYGVTASHAVTKNIGFECETVQTETSRVITERSAGGTAPVKAEAGTGLRIVPNPADDMVRIFLDVPADQGVLRLQVLNLNGQQVFSGLFPSNGELVVPVIGWQNGLYIAKVTGGAMPYTRSFVVQHP